MADRDPFILLRLAEDRIESLVAGAARTRRNAGMTSGWRRTAGVALVRLGRALLADERGEQTAPLRPAGAAR